MRTVLTTFFLGLLFFPLNGKTAEVQFNVEVDQKEIARDEAVSLKFSIESVGSSGRVYDPEFSAPDFDVVNTYQSSYYRNIFENGKFTSKSMQSITKVLKPKKTGKLKISGIQIKIGNEVYKASPIEVTVNPPGAGTPPIHPNQQGGIGLSGTVHKGSPYFFIRAEVNKPKVYKGEQVIVSYYFYHRAQYFNSQVTKFPVLPGFLREDLFLPTGGRMNSERVVVGGIVYGRTLLARYAAYPLRAGKLKIDPFELRFNYYPRASIQDQDDPDPFTQFFQRMTPSTESKRSEPLNLEVADLPQKGKPDSFSGGVGTFEITAAIDKVSVQANEPVNFIVKVEGRGNVSGIGEPQVKWPNSIDLYETKEKAKTGQAGIGEKIFEFLLIPREEGKIEIPAVEISYFDPEKEKYVIEKTKPVYLDVSGIAKGTSLVKRSDRQRPAGETTLAPKEIRYLKLKKETPSYFYGRFWWVWSLMVGVLAQIVLLILMFWEGFRKGFRVWSSQKQTSKKKFEKSWDGLLERARQTDWGSQESQKLYEDFSDALMEFLEKSFQGSFRALSRSQVKDQLIEGEKVSEELWNELSALLEWAEAMQFSGLGKTGSFEQFQKKIKEAERWIEKMESETVVAKDPS